MVLRPGRPRFTVAREGDGRVAGRRAAASSDGCSKPTSTTRATCSAPAAAREGRRRTPARLARVRADGDEVAILDRVFEFCPTREPRIPTSTAHEEQRRTDRWTATGCSPRKRRRWRMLCAELRADPRRPVRGAVGDAGRLVAQGRHVPRRRVDGRLRAAARTHACRLVRPRRGNARDDRAAERRMVRAVADDGPHDVRVEFAAARQRMVEEFGSLPEVTPEAMEWFEECGPLHYEAHIDPRTDRAPRTPPDGAACARIGVVGTRLGVMGGTFDPSITDTWSRPRRPCLSSVSTGSCSCRRDGRG